MHLGVRKMSAKILVCQLEEVYLNLCAIISVQCLTFLQQILISQHKSIITANVIKNASGQKTVGELI